MCRKRKHATRGRHVVEGHWLLALDADAKFAGLLRAGLGVEVVGRALLEPVTVADFCTDVDADRGNSDSDRKPGDDAKSCRSGLFWFGGFWDGQLGLIVEL